MHTKYPTCHKGAFFISLIYFIAGVLWIVLSDYIVVSIIQQADTVVMIGMYKGILFIVVTTVMLYFLTYRFFSNMKSQYEKNQRINESLEFSQAELSKYGTLLNTIINSSPDAIFAKDTKGRYILFNKSVSEMMHRNQKDIVGMDDYAIFKPETAENNRAMDKRVIASKKVITFEEETIDKEGKKRVFLATKGPLLDEKEEAFGIFGISRDITAQKEHEYFLEESREKFYNLSHIDKVTKLPNRLYISEILQQKCLEEAPFSLILLDLDEFKIVNDSYGHRFGDKLLYEISKIFTELFDKSAFIARMGGDEFAIALNQIHAHEIEALMQKLHSKFDSPFKIDMIDIYITASSGISIYPQDAHSMEEMYQAADSAMYNAKRVGKNRFSFYNTRLKEEAVEYTRMVTSLKQAVQNNELELYFQTQNDARSSKIVGAEALLRWKHKGNMISPEIFIPLAERSGLIIEIGDFVLRSAFKTIKRWNELGMLNGRVAINISARQLTHLELIKNLKSILKESGCEASWVELEITESSVLENPQLVINLLTQLREMGFYISMDDFGTGYSSLSYLKNLPINKLKIDRSFITNITQEPKNRIIVKTIIFLAKELGVHVLAEGVETEAEHTFLLQNDIDSIQGYYYAKPMPLDEVEKLLQQV